MIQWVNSRNPENQEDKENPVLRSPGFRFEPTLKRISKPKYAATLIILTPNRLLLIKSREGMQVIELDKILYIQAQGAYAKICLDEEVNIFLCSNLCFMEEILGLHDFLRIHRSFLLNIKKVSGFDSRAGCVWINGIILPVSRRKSAKVFQELLKNGIKDGKKHYRL